MSRRTSARLVATLIAWLLALAISLAACSGANQSAQPTAIEPEAQQQAEQSQQAQQAVSEQEQPAAQVEAKPTQAPSEPAAQQQSEPQQQEQDQAEQSAPQTQGSGEVELSFEPALGGFIFEQPTDMALLPDGSWMVAEQRGSISRFVADGEVQQFGVLDLSSQVVFSGERGLLSIALDRDLESEPYLYVYYSPNDAELSRLSRFTLDPSRWQADAASELVIIEIAQPYANHNGGAVRFGPDGMLYLGIGDGGAANDPHGHGQNRETLLGSIIRIDVDGSSAETPYRVPTDNPFLGVGGVRPETWAYGLRNPWRMSFDPATGDLWVGDVGQDRWEEVSIVGAGENHGWNVFEGDECFGAQSRCDELDNHMPPVAVIPHPEGCSVTGGAVYRGTAIPELIGHYVFGDYCARRIWTIDPLGELTERLTVDFAVISFGVDVNRELLVLTARGPIYRLATR